MTDLNDLAAALDGRQITDDQGQVAGDDTPGEDSAPQEKTTAEDAATAEKPVETKGTSPQEETKESENEPEMVELAADETGKRYVPESRFKEVYAKWKAAQRDAKPAPQFTETTQTAPQQAPPNKADALEIELLRSTIPQFNPDSSDYSRELDELGYSLYEGAKDRFGRYSITRLEAGRKALQMAKKITSKVAEMKTEAKTVKALQSDQGITNRVLNREGAKVDPEKMTLEEKEEWLKANGYW